MNGWVYDSKLGRMLSPDPVTQAPENGQNYNRYTYANNNPLKFTDPSGFRFDLPDIGGGSPASDGGRGDSKMKIGKKLSKPNCEIFPS